MSTVAADWRWGRLAPSAPGPSRPVAPVARHRPPDPRVYRRRRLAAAALLATLAFAAGVFLALVLSTPAGGSLTAQARDAQRVTHVVGPGDTLWQIAGLVAPDDDPRIVVDAIVASRGTSTIVPGDVITWPPR